MGIKSRGDGHALFGEIQPGAKFIKLQSDDKVVRDNYHSTGVEIYVKLWNPAIWTKRYEGKQTAATDHPTAINLYGGAPTHIADDQEVNIIYL